MNAFAETLAQNRRLCLLRTLESAPGYSANDSLLHTMVTDFGFHCSRDQVRTDLAWLAEQQLVTLRELASVYVVCATQRGVDVARGFVTVPGVKRRGPGE